MAGRLVTDELWNEIADLFPPAERNGTRGRKPVDNRTVFTSLVFLLRTGIGWRDLPTELGVSEKTVRRRLNVWTEQGLWERIFEHLLNRLRASGRLNLAEVLIDGGLNKAPCGGEKSVRTQPTEVAVAVN
ncbi:transposase [Roseiconus nitratireducens]|uniref:Transposase n=1 Tax=Roseiconus nitratireducens TaxID=2605748 RepID=A0A5M6CHV0_9BACT|nr:transposase [Roseiconus nitratireducens]